MKPERHVQFLVRAPVSLLKMVEAVQAHDGDPSRNSTVNKALREYVQNRLGRQMAA